MPSLSIPVSEVRKGDLLYGSFYVLAIHPVGADRLRVVLEPPSTPVELAIRRRSGGDAQVQVRRDA